MKKQRQAKLFLSRETLATLTTGSLVRVHGGTVFTTHDTCLETNWTACGCSNATGCCTLTDLTC